MATRQPRRRSLTVLVVLAVVSVLGGGAVWYFLSRPEPRSAPKLCSELSQVASLSQSIVTLDPTTLGPQVAQLQRAVEVAPSDIQAQLSVLASFVEELSEAVRAAPTEKKEALVEALAQRQTEVDAVTVAGQAVEAWSVANCGSPLRTTTTTSTTIKR